MIHFPLLTGVTSNGARNHLSLSKVLWCVGFKPHEFQKITLFLKKSNLRKSHDANQLRYTPFNQHSNGKNELFEDVFPTQLGGFQPSFGHLGFYRRSCWILAFLRLDRSSYTPTRQVGELVLPPKLAWNLNIFPNKKRRNIDPNHQFFWGSKCWFFLGGTLPVNWHGNGKWTVWRCISLWKWGDFIAMLVYWRGI